MMFIGACILNRPFHGYTSPDNVEAVDFWVWSVYITEWYCMVHEKAGIGAFFFNIAANRVADELGLVLDDIQDDSPCISWEKYKTAFAMDFVTGGLAACGASIFSNPFDVVKTRMQLQGELRAKGHHDIFYKNVFHASLVIGKNEGIRGLQKGLVPAMTMHSVRNCIRLGSYQWLNKNGYLTNEQGKTIFYKTALASAICGAAGAFMGSPLFLIKTQIQSQAAANISVGTQHGHSGAVGAFKTIYSKEGIPGLWRGANATMLRAVAGSSAQLTSFAITKDVLAEYELFRNMPVLSSLLSSIVGGVFQCLLMNPFDLVSVRLYNQGVDKNGKGLMYNNIPDAFIKIAKSEGFSGFYKGVGANYMRLAPHGALCLVFWDILKDLQAKHLP